MDPAPRSPQPRAVAWLAIALAIAALLLYLPGIGDGDFVGDDEALDAGVVVEMARSGDWWFPEFNGEYLPPKPPLYYWAARLVSLVTGKVDEWSVRAPSALAAAGLVAITVCAVAPTQGIGAAAVAGIVLLTMPVVRDQARVGRCDMLLALLVTASLSLAIEGWESRRRRWAFAFLFGLAALTKGGAGVGIVVVTLFAVAGAERSLRPIAVFFDPSMIAFFVVATSWYAIGVIHWGRRFVDEQIIGENLNHLIGGEGLSDRAPGTRSLGYHLGFYTLNLFGTTAPWSLLAPVAAIDAWRHRAVDPRRQFFLAWILAPMIFLTVAARKSPYYLLPLAPAVAALVATWAWPKIRASLDREPFALPIGGRAAIASLGLSVVLWLAIVMLRIGGCEGSALGGALWRHPLAAIASVWVLAMALVVLVDAARARKAAASFAATAVALASSWVLVAISEGPIANCRSLRPFARLVAERAAPKDALFFFESPLPAIALYAERNIPTLRNPAKTPPTPPFLLIVPESLRDEVPAPWLAASETIARGHGRVFTRRAMGIELLRVKPASSEAPPS